MSSCKVDHCKLRGSLTGRTALEPFENYSRQCGALGVLAGDKQIPDHIG
jgi:hypothetical protein